MGKGQILREKKKGKEQKPDFHRKGAKVAKKVKNQRYYLINSAFSATLR